MPTADAVPSESTAPILSIQHFCLHDGPGIRSLVFFKGCPLRCTWCQNPESWKARTELGYKAHLCVDCHACTRACPVGTSPDRLERAACRRCFACVDACPAEARVRFGTISTVGDVLEELAPELALLRSSGGGVTLTGGEPLVHAAFALDLVAALHDEGIHVAIETCGCHNASEQVSALLDAIDLLIFDIKLFDPAEHERYCGIPNDGIKDTLRLAASRAREGGPRVWPRMPVVPGITTTRENLSAWAQWLTDLGLRQVTLIPYHSMGDSKRAWVGMRKAAPIEKLSETVAEDVRATLEAAGLTCFAPGEEPT